jgi:hypothetical protein
VTGWLLHAGDYQQAAARVGELLQDAPLRASMGAAARRHAEQNLSITPSVQSLMLLFTTLAGGGEVVPLSQDAAVGPRAAAANR